MAPRTPEEMKWIAFVALVVQNTALVLFMRYSLTKSTDHYIVTTAVAVMEIVKVSACLIYERLIASSNKVFFEKIKREVFNKPKECMYLAVPSILYTLQNNLLYIALSNLDAATYQVCYQLKILTTAVFSTLLLNRKISPIRWFSLVMLTIGISLAQLDASTKKDNLNTASEKTDSSNAKDLIKLNQNPTVGFTCVILASITSGFAGVWVEKILKQADTSFWIRNIQMGITSIVIAFLCVWSKDYEEVKNFGFFHGYNFSVYSVIFFQAIGGLIVAAVVKYADNILKGFGSSMSIVASCTIEALFFDFQATAQFVLGAVLVNYSMFIYSLEQFSLTPILISIGLLPEKSSLPK